MGPERRDLMEELKESSELGSELSELSEPSELLGSELFGACPCDTGTCE